MKLGDRVKKLILDEAGGEVMEYALILGGISLVALAVIIAFGPKVIAAWEKVDQMK
jgi:Flp pilus assembly pilin Flp